MKSNILKKLTALIITISFLTEIAIKAQAFAQIPHINSTIVVDGIADNVWTNLQEHPITFLIDGKSYPTTSDCSGYFKAFWNLDTLFVLIFAYDNILYTKDTTVFYNDGYEIYLDVNNTKGTIYTDDCYQFRFIPGSKDITGRWGLNVWTPPTVNFGISVNEGISRTLEAVFPLIALGKKSQISVGDSMGFEIEILDNDGQGRNHVLSWNNNLHMAWYDPGKMGTVEFVDVVSEVNNFQSTTLSVFPNPASRYLTINSSNSINEIFVYTMQGQMICRKVQINSSETSLNLAFCPSGFYIMKLKLNNGELIDYKMIKQ